MELCSRPAQSEKAVPLRVTRHSSNTINIHMSNVFAETLPLKDESHKHYLSEDVTSGFDPVTGFPLRQLSQIFYLVLPPNVMDDPQAWHIELWETLVNAPQEADMFQLIQKHNSRAKSPFRHILTGSRAEHLNIPAFLSLGQDFHVSEVQHSDLDILFSVGTVDPHQLQSSDSVNIFPGYVKYSGPERELMAMLYKYFQHRKLFLTQMHGPALMGDRPLTLWDFVVCLEHPHWPTVAAEWATRKRPSDWPPKMLIQEIVRNGCHIVQKAPPKYEENIAKSTSKTPSYSWQRYSFSVAEKNLSSSLTGGQRQSYLLLRIICFWELKEFDILNSYHLKNIFFWTCEKIPRSRWIKENLAENILLLLNSLLRCIVKRNLPHYFIPENNLLNHLSNESLRVIAKKLAAIRKEPWRSLQRFCGQFHFISGPFSFGTDDMIKDIVNKCQGLPSTSGSISDSSVIELATAFISDCPATEKLAHDFLQCTIYPGSSEHCMLILQNYTRRVLKPFLAASDILFSHCSRSQVNLFFHEISSLVQSFHDDDIRNSCTPKEILRSTICDVFRHRDSHLQVIARRLLSFIPPVDTLIRVLDGIVQRRAVSAVSTAQLVLTLFYSYHLVITFHPDHLEAGCHMHYLQQVQQHLQRLSYPRHFISCAENLQYHALIKHGLLVEISSFIHKCSDVSLQQQSLPVKEEMELKFPTSCKGVTTKKIHHEMRPMETDPHGRFYTIEKHDLIDNSTSEILRNLDFVRNIPDHNLVKHFLQYAIEDKFDPSLMEGDSHVTFQLTYAMHLYLMNQFWKSIKVLDDILLAFVSLQRVEKCPHIFFLGVLHAQKLFGKSFISTSKRTFKQKVPVLSQVLANYLRLMVGIQIGETHSRAMTALLTACMIFEREENQACEIHWHCSSNNLTIAASGFTAQSKYSEALFTLSHAASIAYRTGSSHSTQLTGTSTEHCCSTQQVLELSLGTHWALVPLNDAIRGLAMHLYPGKSLSHSTCLVLDLLLPHPRTPQTIDDFLSRLRTGCGELQAVAQYMSTWQYAMRTAFPRLGPQYRIKRYLRLKYPNLKERDALQKIYEEMGTEIPHRTWMVAFMFSLAGEFSHYNTILDPFLITFYADLPAEMAICHLMALLYPPLEPGVAICQLFSDFTCPGADFETAVSMLHPDPVKALVLAMFVPTA